MAKTLSETPSTTVLMRFAPSRDTERVRERDRDRDRERFREVQRERERERERGRERVKERDPWTPVRQCGHERPAGGPQPPPASYDRYT